MTLVLLYLVSDELTRGRVTMNEVIYDSIVKTICFDLRSPHNCTQPGVTCHYGKMQDDRLSVKTN